MYLTTHNRSSVSAPALKATCDQGRNTETSPLHVADFSNDNDECDYRPRIGQGESSSLPSQPIACPLSSSQHDEDMMSYEEEKIYYNALTWTMYSRIMRSRQSVQQQLTQKGTTTHKVTPRSKTESIVPDNMDEEEESNTMAEEIFYIEI